MTMEFSKILPLLCNNNNTKKKKKTWLGELENYNPSIP
jgi:hypothetical protein